MTGMLRYVFINTECFKNDETGSTNYDNLLCIDIILHDLGQSYSQFSLEHMLLFQVDHLFARITEVRNFMSRWMEIGEKLVFLTEMDEDSVDADPEI